MRALKLYEVHLLFVTALYLIGLTVYSNSLGGPFIFDDYPNIRDNASIRMTRVDIDSLYRAGFESPSERRPLANISFALNYYFGDYNVLGYHLVNVLVHISNGVLVYFLVLLMGRTNPNPAHWRWVAFIASAVFLTHPIQTQAVAYIVQRMTSLAVLFYLLSLLLYVLGRHNPAPGKRFVLWCFAGLAGVCAGATKEIAVTLPVTILLWEWYFERQAGAIEWSRVWTGVVLAGMSVAALGLIYLGAAPLEPLSALYEARDFTVWQRLMTETRVVALYLGLVLWPTPERFNLLHEISVSYGLLAPPVTLVCSAGVLVLAGLALWLKRALPVVSFGVLWFFLHLVLESSVVGLELVYEHRMYLPMVGISVMFAYLLGLLLQRYRIETLALVMSLIVLLGSGAYLRNLVWQDRLALWVDVVLKNPDSARVRNNLGRALSDHGRNDEAVTQFIEALFLQPDYPEAHNNLAVSYAKRGRFPEAVHHFRQALELQPDYPQARHNYGLTLFTGGRYADAIEQLRAAISTKPRYARARITLASVLMKVGETQTACEHLDAARRLEPRQAGIEAMMKHCVQTE